MIERLGIAIIIIALALAAYQFSKWWMIRRFNDIESDDPVLSQINGKTPSIVYFTADFCTACKAQQRPNLARLRQEMGDASVNIIQIDAERQPEAAKKWGIMSLPTTIVLDPTGDAHAVNYGVASTQKLKKQLEQVS